MTTIDRSRTHCDTCEQPRRLYRMGGYWFCFACFRGQIAAHGSLKGPNDIHAAKEA